mgnify:CR=1 FL=1
MRLSPFRSIDFTRGATLIVLFAKGRLAEERSDGVRAEPKASLEQRVSPPSWGLAWREGSGVGGTVTGVSVFDYGLDECMICRIFIMVLRFIERVPRIQFFIFVTSIPYFALKDR